MIMNGSDVISPREGANLPTPSSSPQESGYKTSQMTNEGPPMCVGCGQIILDEFILRVQGRLWHSTCLSCCVCHINLKQACYARGTQVFCEKDFFRLFGAQCAACGGGIPPTENVRRAQDNIYHVTCFSCIACETQLETGSEFYLRDDGRLICSHDYHQNKITGDDENATICGKKSRSALSEVQADMLSKAFLTCSKPSRNQRTQIATEIGVDQRVVQVWFQNKRAKFKKTQEDITPDGNNNRYTNPIANGCRVPTGGYPLPIVNSGAFYLFFEPNV